jgi:hypothetical protein
MVSVTLFQRKNGWNAALKGVALGAASFTLVAAGVLSAEAKDGALQRILSITGSGSRSVSDDSVQSITGSGSRSITGSGSRSITGSGSRVIAGDDVHSITGSGSRSITGSGSRSITGSGSRVIAGDDVHSITGSGSRSITGSGSRSITGSGSRVIAGDDVHSITGSGSRSITGSGSRSITGSGSRSYGEVGSLSLFGPLQSVDGITINVMGQSVDVASLWLDSHDLQIDLGKTVYVEGVIVGDVLLADLMIVSSDFASPGASEVMVVGEVSASSAGGTELQIGSLQLDATATGGLAVEPGDVIGVVGTQPVLGGIILVSDQQVDASSILDLGDLTDRFSSTPQSITGSGSRAIEGDDVSSITGSGSRSITGSGSRSITGSGSRSITGSGSRSITGSGSRSITGSGSR